ncbi:hypothetical protein MUN88_10575 [Gracilibacillus caseinilyticus]|uniref:YfhD-like protein n=1 Tax=Gracilibacillus caseinilyticus TaxID=2932256 RepID=A0ABY4F1P7_9BACI|nr:hypothetical protein [Gracilibacillus caseinilyticus]UOQ50458.1 hypothetical protein MUN88_10575 [Gracilibacillus caseinilyticus]
MKNNRQQKNVQNQKTEKVKKQPDLSEFEELQTVDEIPLKDVEIEEKNIRQKENSQSTSESEQKHRKDK